MIANVPVPTEEPVRLEKAEHESVSIQSEQIKKEMSSFVKAALGDRQESIVQSQPEVECPKMSIVTQEMTIGSSAQKLQDCLVVSQSNLLTKDAHNASIHSIKHQVWESKIFDSSKMLEGVHDYSAKNIKAPFSRAETMTRKLGSNADLLGETELDDKR